MQDWREILEHTRRWDSGRIIAPTREIRQSKMDYRPRERQAKPPRPSRPLYTLTCTSCASTFTNRRRGTRFCSRKCRDAETIRLRALSRARIAEEKRKALTPGYLEMRRMRLAQHLASVRPKGPGSIGPREKIYSKVCPCGEMFQSGYENSKWHSATCRKRHQRMGYHG